MWNAEDPKDDVLAMVVRTGINSTLGTLVKQFISPTQIPGRDPFINVSFTCTHHVELSAAVTCAETGSCLTFKCLPTMILGHSVCYGHVHLEVHQYMLDACVGGGGGLVWGVWDDPRQCV